MSLFVIPDAKLRQNSACSRNRLGLLGRADKGASRRPVQFMQLFDGKVRGRDRITGNRSARSRPLTHGSARSLRSRYTVLAHSVMDALGN